MALSLPSMHNLSRGHEEDWSDLHCSQNDYEHQCTFTLGESRDVVWLNTFPCDRWNKEILSWLQEDMCL